MFRKSLIWTAFLLYMLSNSHVSLAMHYCCGEVVDWSLAGEAEKCCESTKEKKNCCRDVQLAFDVDEDQASPEVVNLEFTPVMIVIAALPAAVEFDFPHAIADEIRLSDHAPPDMSVRQFYLLYEVFRL
jgi:hypothetical protein